MKILLAAAELAPLAKAGGLGDACAALGGYLHRQGHDVRILLPFYADIETRDLEVYPVEFLQDIRVSLGPHRFTCSVDATRLPGQGAPVYLLRCPALYDRPGLYSRSPDEHLRFILLNRMAFEMCQRMGWSPDVFHCNDWHTALIPLYRNTVYAWDDLFATSRALLSIHNIAYQGVIGAGSLGELELTEHRSLLDRSDLEADRINILKTGIVYADMVSTVSPTYAREIQTTDHGMGLERLLQARSHTLAGILNGVDYNVWNPETDALIPFHYGPADMRGKKNNKKSLMRELGLEYVKKEPLMGLVARLTPQKGLDLVENVLPEMLTHRNFSLVALGSGEPRYEDFFRWLQGAFPGRVAFYQGYNEKLSHMIEAGSDMFLMPSAFEPCGLNQMYSMKYGTVPIVRQTGGLADSVELYDPATGIGTGIVFRHYDHEGLRWAIDAALALYRDKKVWRRLMRNAMTRDFSWEKQGAEYVHLYRSMIGNNAAYG